MNKQAQLRNLLAAKLNLQELALDTFDNDAPLLGEGLGLDSLDAVELAEIVREQFGVRISTHEEGQAAFLSINALVSFIESRQPA